MTAEQSKRRGGNVWITAAWVSVTSALLLTPLIAMQFTDEVNWTVSDFAFAGAMLVGSGIIYELAARAGNLAYRGGVIVALATGVMIMWTTGAVGIIGSEANPGNLLYVAVVPLAIIGAIVARARAAGMIWAMVLAAVATLLAPFIAYAGIASPRSDVLAPEVYAATGVFVIGWLLAAGLFRLSVRTRGTFLKHDI